MTREELINQLKAQIIEYLNLSELEPKDLDSSMALFGPESKVELDSIDAIELSVLMEREYGVKITDSKEGKKVMYSIDKMADYIEKLGK